MSSPGLRHTVSFVGTYLFGLSPEVPAVPSLVVLDREVENAARTAGLDRQATDVIIVEGRPDQRTVELIARRLASASVAQIVAAGAGAVLDAAKLATRLREPNSRNLRLVLAPCGAEPYRAVARFAVVDDGPRNRPTVVDERFGASVVLILPELLAGLSERVVAVHSLDTLVHAIESLVSRRTNPVSRALATTAIRLTMQDGADPAWRVSRVLAACLATEAFAATGLGIAHAIASPLGTELGVTHDGINGVLGRALIQFWGPEAPGFTDVSRALGVSGTVEAVTDRLDRLREVAGLPPALRELGIGWDSVVGVLPKAAQSSGIPFLPRPLGTGDLERFANQAWTGKEVAHGYA